MPDPTKRSCGGCTQCCDLVPVRDIGKHAFARCPQLSTPPAAQVGCAIHTTRPWACRLWSCVWLKDPTWDDELRPDRCGVVFDELPDVVGISGVEYPCIQAWVRPGPRPEGWWLDPPIAMVVLGAFDKGLVVLFRTSPQSAFAVWRGPDGVIHSNERNPTVPMTREPDSLRLLRAGRLMAAARRHA